MNDDDEASTQKHLFFQRAGRVKSGKTDSAENPFRVAMLNRVNAQSKLRRFFHVTEARLKQSGARLFFKECGVLSE